MYNNYLKTYKSIYNEEAVSSNDISSNPYFCLYVGKSKDYKDIVLYDKFGIIKKDSNKSDIKINIDYIYAYGEMETSKHNPFSCWSVIRSVAKNKYGAFLYDTMLSIAGKSGLIPDRGSVSDDASNVWEYYFKKRQSEFNLIKIDNFKNPETPDKRDDAFIHFPNMTYNDRHFIDYVYYYKNYNKHLKFVKILKDNNTKFLKELSDNGYDSTDFKIELFNAGSTFFSNKYNK
jgi:hypothetical protein